MNLTPLRYKVTVGVLLAALSFFAAAPTFAHGDTVEGGGHTAREEAEGLNIWQELQSGKLSCAELTDDNFGAVGEYVMGRMMGGGHETMNNMMVARMGANGEREMHIVMGKRMSGCEVDAALPESGAGFMQTIMSGGIMGGRMGTFGGSFGGGMMNMGIFSLGWFGLFFMLLWWVLVIIGIVALFRWALHWNTARPLKILKERYAKGEINKKEFEEMRKNLAP